ncbi:MAG: right-handed parallel beta-helix repeat-containing protein [Kiritimatiellaeota bacterium]|nr:right-handed parallel beta-helix repeat-containing protein [Kiritimatiellota bacterium]
MKARWLTLLLLLGVAHAAPTVTVMQDGSGQVNGTDHQPIQAAINQVLKQGGGEIVIDKGEYVIGASLKITAATNLTIRGKPGAVLRLPPLPYAQSLEAAVAGATLLHVDRAASFQPGTPLHFDAPGKVHPFTGKPVPCFTAALARVDGDHLILAAPLEFPAPAGTRLYREDHPNIFKITGACDNLTLTQLTLDGGKRADDPKISGHIVGCGVLAEGPFTYERGPTGAPVRRLTIRDCVIQHCYGRGVAFYAVTDSTVERCIIEDTVDEAIDFDHFATGCRALSNTIRGSTEGMELNDSSDCLVQSNRFESCDIGINLWRWCHQPDLDVRNRILDNQFNNTHGSALLIQANTASNTISGNVISGCGAAGIVLEGSTQTLTSNVVTGATAPGIVIKGSGQVVRDNV